MRATGAMTGMQPDSTNGTSRSVLTFLTSPTKPMSDEALTTKYRELAGEVLPQQQLEDLEAAVWALDEAADVSDVARLMQR